MKHYTRYIACPFCREAVDPSEFKEHAKHHYTEHQVLEDLELSPDNEVPCNWCGGEVSLNSWFLDCGNAYHKPCHIERTKFYRVEAVTLSRSIQYEPKYER